MSEKMPSTASAISREVTRFESVHQSLQDLHRLLQQIDNIPVKIHMRELVNNIEGKSTLLQLPLDVVDIFLQHL